MFQNRVKTNRNSDKQMQFQCYLSYHQQAAAVVKLTTGQDVHKEEYKVAHVDIKERLDLISDIRGEFTYQV